MPISMLPNIKQHILYKIVERPNETYCKIIKVFDNIKQNIMDR